MRHAALLLGPILALVMPAQGTEAKGYGVYSSAGWNPAFVLVMPPSRLPPPWANPAPLGTEPNPMPIYGPATAFETGRAVLYNAPPSPGDLYRVVPHR